MNESLELGRQVVQRGFIGMISYAGLILHRAMSLIGSMLLSVCVIFSSVHVAHADDTEIFFGAQSGNAPSAKPNVLLILDTSSSMTQFDGYSESRVDRMKRALLDIIRSSSGVNMGLMRFNKPGGPILYPVKDVDSQEEEGDPALVRDVLLDIAGSMETSGGTPIVDVLYEAGLYFRGGEVHYGKNRGWNGTEAASNWTEAPYRERNRVSHPKSYTHGEVLRRSECTDSTLNAYECKSERIVDNNLTDSVAGPKYISPISSECQANHIVLLSDGEASVNDSFSRVEALIGRNCTAESGREKCGSELAAFLHTTDQSSVGVGANLSGDQTINVHTIGFNLNDRGNQFLKDIARVGGGKFNQADSYDDLFSVFDNFFAEITDAGSTFVTPGVAVSSFNRLSHENELYFSLFKPETSPYWHGNLKRYQLDGEQVVDRDGDNAVGSDGFFKKGSRSFWSSSDDDGDVELGGALEQLQLKTNRKVYTYIGNYSNGSAALLSDLDSDNNDVSKALLSIEGESDEYREELIEWMIGKNQDRTVTDTSGTRVIQGERLADPLHSSPHVVIYGGEESNPDSTVYYGDNQGYLHAIDGASGNELFAFMPQEMLALQDGLYQNAENDGHPYGLDGNITTWVQDVKGDGVITQSEGDRVYLYIGMRRGGKNYYALDVTDRGAPKLLWVIKGGEGDFRELGQSWSQPTHARIIVGTEAKDVLVFAGGYDPAQDDVLERTEDNQGRAIYIVDAQTGDKIWAGGEGIGSDKSFADMKYSIPSKVVVLDLDSDGYAEKMFVGDVGGQLWRFDIANGNTGSGLVNGGVIFTASENANFASNRRFYHEPDISLYRRDRQQIMAIKIGSGFHAHPLAKTGSESTAQTADDRFYMIKDTHLRSKPSSYVNVREIDLYDATDNAVLEGDREGAQVALDSGKGWYIRLPRDGEKVLASSLTVNNEVYFTTYEPTQSTGCSVASGTARVYHVNAVLATPVPQDGEVLADLIATDRETVLDTASIAPTPIRVVIDGKELILAGPEVISAPEGIGRNYLKTFWHQE